jgi:hypothetical protein
MSIYVNKDDEQLTQATITVHEDPRSAKITYRGKRGETFSVMVHQKPNPIGFHAKLPGDRRR